MNGTDRKPLRRGGFKTRPYDLVSTPRPKVVQWLRVLLFACHFVLVSAAAADCRDEIPFVPTPIEVVDRMLEIAQVKRDDVVYDLGSGDGRIVIRAAKKYGARGVGIEMDRLLLAKAKRAAAAEDVAHLVEFRAEDALQTDISPATVVTLYMLPWFNDAMKPRFARDLKPGARIVAHDFGIEGWEPERIEILDKPVRLMGGVHRPHKIYLWRIK